MRFYQQQHRFYCGIDPHAVDHALAPLPLPAQRASQRLRLRLGTWPHRTRGREGRAHPTELGGIQLTHERANLLQVAPASPVRAQALSRHHRLAQGVRQRDPGQMRSGQRDELCPECLQGVRLPFPLAFARPRRGVSHGGRVGVERPRAVIGVLPWRARYRLRVDPGPAAQAAGFIERDAFERDRG